MQFVNKWVLRRSLERITFTITPSIPRSKYQIERQFVWRCQAWRESLTKIVISAKALEGSIKRATQNLYKSNASNTSLKPFRASAAVLCLFLNPDWRGWRMLFDSQNSFSLRFQWKMRDYFAPASQINSIKHVYWSSFRIPVHAIP